MLEQLELLFKSILELLLLLLNPVVFIPILIIILVCYFQSKKYKEESYYKITKISLFNVRRDTGRYGEYLTYKNLKNYENLGAKFLFNIYVPKKDEETSEIDVLMISKKGLFVFESKNYSGWIFGNDGQRYWYQTLPSGRGRSHKEKFYNPVFQNKNHLKYLECLLSMQIPMFSIITFSERCTLKDVNVKNTNVSVINRNQVYNVVTSIYNNNQDVLTDIQIEEIYNILYPYTQVDENTKQQHIDNINNNIRGKTEEIISEQEINDVEQLQNNETNEIDETADSIINNNNVTSLENIELNNAEPLDNQTENIEEDKTHICPNCGGKLVLRKARYGEHSGEEFYGCSNYPKCKFIKKL